LDRREEAAIKQPDIPYLDFLYRLGGSSQGPPVSCSPVEFPLELSSDPLPRVFGPLELHQTSLFGLGELLFVEDCFGNDLVEDQQGPFVSFTPAAQKEVDSIPVRPYFEARLQVIQLPLNVICSLVDSGFPEHLRQKVDEPALSCRIKRGTVAQHQPDRHIGSQMRRGGDDYLKAVQQPSLLRRRNYRRLPARESVDR